MNLTLGKDIGIVMAKGVMFGVICVVTVLPSMILILNPIIEKTKHREIFPKFTRTKNFVIKHYIAIAVAFLIILPVAFFGYRNTDIYYNLDKSLPKTLDSVIANSELKEKFNMVSMELLLIDKDIPDYSVNEMLEEIENLDGIEWTISYSKIGSLGLPKEMIPEEVLSIFQNDKYQMILINSKYEMATDELNSQVEKVNDIIKKYDPNAILAGEGPLMKDLVQISDHDFNSVNRCIYCNYICNYDYCVKIDFTSSNTNCCNRICNIYKYGNTILYKYSTSIYSIYCNWNNTAWSNNRLCYINYK